MTKKYKYPRTPHMGHSNPDADDIILESSFEGKEVVVSLKMDGESTSLYRNASHARSMDSKHHPSRSWIKQLQSNIGYMIPEDYRICGENMFATHQIHYRQLGTYFFVYSIFDENNKCLDWEETKMWCEELGLQTVPVFYEGIYDIEKIHKSWENFQSFPTFIKKDTSVICPKFPDDFEGTKQEGYVVRLKSSYPYERFSESVAKYVRVAFKENLEEANKHWTTTPVFPNSLD